MFAFFRQLQLNKTSENLSKQYNCEIEAFKLKHRKLRYNIATFRSSQNLIWIITTLLWFYRITFENQLYQLIDQEKDLQLFFVCLVFVLI